MIKEKFCQRIKISMLEQSLTATDLCKRTGIPKSAMSQYINGRIFPKHDRLILIANALNTNPSWLLGFDDFSTISHVKNINFPIIKKAVMEKISVSKTSVEDVAKKAHVSADKLRLLLEDDNEYITHQDILLLFRLAFTLNIDASPVNFITETIQIICEQLRITSDILQKVREKKVTLSEQELQTFIDSTSLALKKFENALSLLSDAIYDDSDPLK